MKIRESGMPNEKMWNSFFDSEEILKQLNFDNKINDVLEFGSGYGTFTIPASSIITGNIFALDVEPEMIQILKSKIQKHKITNINVIQTDFVLNGTGLKNESVDYVFLFNILHSKDPMNLLYETFRILKKNGKVGIIHWINSEKTPRGPSLEIRPTEDQCVKWLNDANIEIEKKPFSLPPYHYGLVGIKK